MNDYLRTRKGPSAKIDPARVWSLNYRLLMNVITSVAGEIETLGLETKELFMLAGVDAHPHPAELATALSMPKPTVTFHLKRLEAAGYVERKIDAADLRRHRLCVTPAGRSITAKGLAKLSEAFGARLARLDTDEQAEFTRLLERLS